MLTQCHHAKPCHGRDVTHIGDIISLLRSFVGRRVRNGISSYLYALYKERFCGLVFEKIVKFIVHLFPMLLYTNITNIPRHSFSTFLEIYYSQIIKTSLSNYEATIISYRDSHKI